MRDAAGDQTLGDANARATRSSTTAQAQGRRDLATQIKAMIHTESVAEVWALYCDAMAAHGFDRLIYGFTRFVSDAENGALDDALFLTNHAPRYFDRYIGDRLVLAAPMIRWARSNQGAISWGRLWSRSEDQTDEERRIIAFNQEMGVRAGYSIGLTPPSPGGFGAVALTARDGMDQAAVDALWHQVGDEIETLTQVAHLKILTLPHTTERSRELTPRQREVLDWVARGKSYADIAQILGVALPTVEKHARLARENLRAETTAQAVLRAAFLNLITQ